LLAIGNYIVANSNSCCFSIRIQGWFCRNMEGFIKTDSLDIQTLKMSLEQILCVTSCEFDKWTESQNYLLKAYPLSAIRNNKLNTQGKQLETSAKSVRVFVSNIYIVA